jgi:hypothetical protein
LRTFYVNAAFGFPEDLLRRVPIHAVLFHTKFLGVRWSIPQFRRCLARCAYLKTLDCPKIALPQDEFLNTDVLNEFINDFGITHVLTCAEEKDWPTIYDRVDREKVRLRTVLTGYIDPLTVARVARLKRDGEPRDIDVGYRAWRAEKWLGELSQHKVWVAERFAAMATADSLRMDISLEDKDVLAGDDWFRFLLRCKATVGAEGGASVLDRDSRIRAAVGEYVKGRPDANFAEVRDACFPAGDHAIRLLSATSRHFEACQTETLQFLVEGHYSGILQPWRHYVPVKKDYSNVREALQVLARPESVALITSTAYREIVESDRWTYPTFVRDVEQSFLEPQPDRAEAPRNQWREMAIFVMICILDLGAWLLVIVEATLFRNHKLRLLTKRALIALRMREG